MLASEFAAFDRLQSGLALLREDVARLVLRVAALESGIVLPADQQSAYAVSILELPKEVQPITEDGSPATPEVIAECRAAQAVLLAELNMTTGLPAGAARR